MTSERYVPARPALVEACVDSVDAALAAEAAGAGRVELCAGLVEGGSTPSAGMIDLCASRLRIPLFVMIRPRAGDFCYSSAEVEVMRRDVERAAACGASGVVLGILRPDGTVDARRMRPLIAAARPLAVTFHRAFDVARDADEALDAIVALGIDRVLTSGRAATALEGIAVIARLVERAKGKLGVVAGGGVRGENARRIVLATGVSELHLRGASLRPSPMEYRNPAVSFGGRATPEDHLREVTDPATIAAVVRQLEGSTDEG